MYFKKNKNLKNKKQRMSVRDIFLLHLMDKSNIFNLFYR